MLRNFGEEKFDIIIQAGQSNSEGCGLGDAANPFVPRSEILYLNNDFSIGSAQEIVEGNNIRNNFSLSFCTKYIESDRLKSERKLLVVRAGLGGTGFLDKRWGITDDLYIRMMEMTKTALDLNSENRLIALLWHQGETDALLNAGRLIHFNNLKRLVDSVRKTFDCENLPFIAGDFVSHWKNENLAICEPVILAIKDVCQSVGYARFVETSQLLSNDQKIKNQDIIHFCRESLDLLGIKYYKAYCEIIDNTKN